MEQAAIALVSKQAVSDPAFAPKLPLFRLLATMRSSSPDLQSVPTAGCAMLAA
jgi:hypothetical protein